MLWGWEEKGLSLQPACVSIPRVKPRGQAFVKPPRCERDKRGRSATNGSPCSKQRFPCVNKLPARTALEGNDSVLMAVFFTGPENTGHFIGLRGLSRQFREGNSIDAVSSADGFSLHDGRRCWQAGAEGKARGNRGPIPQRGETKMELKSQHGTSVPWHSHLRHQHLLGMEQKRPYQEDPPSRHTGCPTRVTAGGAVPTLCALSHPPSMAPLQRPLQRVQWPKCSTAITSRVQIPWEAFVWRGN